MKTLSWFGITVAVLLYVGCDRNRAGSDGDAAVSSGSGGASGSGGSAAPIGGGGAGGGDAAVSSGSGGAGSGGAVDAGSATGSGGAAVPAADGGSAPSDATQAACMAGTLRPGNSTLMIQSGGAMRSYIVHVPPMYDGKKRLPLVVDLHGAGDTAAHQITWSGWREKADAVGFVVIYPQGIGNTWNGGPPNCPVEICCCNPAQAMNIDDAGFLRAVVTKTAQDGCIDLRRVYATGLSNGGIMAHWLACDAADMFAAVAPVSGPNMVDCKPARPVSVVLYRGRMDSGVLYNGGAAPGGRHNWLSAMADFNKWSELDSCTDAPVPMPGHPVCQMRSQCAGGVEVVLCSPNAPHNLYGTVMNQMVAVADVAWEIFERHALPPVSRP